MTKTTRARSIWIALAAAVAAAVLLTGSGTAHAAGTLSLNGNPSYANPFPATHNGTIAASGTGFGTAGASFGNSYSIAICNTTLDPTGGTECSLASGVQDNLVAGNFSETIPVRATFANFNFQTGSFTGNVTKCAGYTGTPLGGAVTGNCALQLVVYPGVTPGGTPVDFVSAPLSFT